MVAPRTIQLSPVAGSLLGALVVFLAVVFPSVVVVERAGATLDGPAARDLTYANGGLGDCQEHHDCGMDGVLALTFALSRSATLSRTIQSSVPLDLDVTSGVYTAMVQCMFWWPPSNCTLEVGPGAWFEMSPSSFRDLSTLGDRTVGGPAVLAPGDSTLYLVNANTTTPVTTVGSPILAQPTLI